MPCGAVEAIIRDSREAYPGALYVALKGEQHDGHDFLPSVQAAGAWSVVERGHARATEEGYFLEVDDVRAALGRLAAAYRCLFPVRVVGITGSAGKTTTKELIANILAGLGETVKTPGNFNNDIGVPLSLFHLHKGARFGVFEAGMSNPGEIAPLCRMIQPEVGVVTSIGRAHVDAFESLDGVAMEKAALLRSLPAAGLAVLDMDEPYYAMLSAASAASITACSFSNRSADYVGGWQMDAPQRLQVRESRTGEEAVLILPSPGKHIADNVLKAVAVGRHFGASWELLQAAVEHTTFGPMRWDISAVNGVRVVNDAYNANPDSMRAALKAFSLLACGGRRWLALGDMLSLGDAAAAEHEALGEWLAEMVSTVGGLVWVGPAAACVAEGLKAKGCPMDGFYAAASHAAGAGWLRERMAPGDSLFLKGSRGSHMEDVLDGLKEGSV